MSKYNNGSSIPVESLSQEELKLAIKEWAEGNSDMEKLLWTFYNNGIKTTGCHVGYGSYIALDYNPEQKDVIAKLIDMTLQIEGSQVLISPDGGNPYSGDDWYKPGINLGFDTNKEEEASSIFKLLDATINSESHTYDEACKSLIELVDFLVGKLSDLLIRIQHGRNGEYSISIEGKIKDENKALELNKILTQIGFTLSIPWEEDYARKSWDMNIKGFKELCGKIKEITQIIIENYSLPIPTLEDDEDKLTLRTKAHLKRKQSLEETGDLKQFKQWLKEEKNRLNGINQKK